MIIGTSAKIDELGEGKFRFEAGGELRHFQKNGIWRPVELNKVEASAPSGLTHLYKQNHFGLGIDANKGRFRVYPDTSDFGAYVEVYDIGEKPVQVSSSAEGVVISRRINAWNCTFRATFNDRGFFKEFIFDNVASIPDTIKMGMKIVGLTRQRQGRQIKLGKKTVMRLPDAIWYAEDGGYIGLVSENIQGEVVTLDIDKSAMAGVSGKIIIDPTLTLPTNVPGPDSNGLYQQFPNSVLNATPNLDAGWFINFQVRHSIFRWDISSIPAGSTIDSSTLTLFVTFILGAASGRTYNINEVTQRAWVHSQATYNVYSTGNNWATPGGDYTTVGAAQFVLDVAANNTKSIDVTTHTQNQLALGSLEQTMTDEGTLVFDALLEVGAEDNPTANKRPLLVINYMVAGEVNLLDFKRGPVRGSLRGIRRAA